MNILYLHGFNSSPKQEKALFFSQQFAKLGIPFFAPDMGETFVSHSFTEKLEIALGAIPNSPTIVIGSSLGGYLAALVAARNQMVKGLILMAPAFGCFERYPEQQKDYEKYPDVKCSTLVFAAEFDEAIPMKEINGFIEDDRKFIIVNGADHRFSGKLPILWEEIVKFIPDVTNYINEKSPNT